MRFFLAQAPQAGTAVLNGEEMHHLLHVYRGRPGMHIELFDREGVHYEALITTCDKKTVHLQILSRQEPLPTTHTKIVLAQALIKSKSWDVVLQKCMEIGVDRLIPIISDHLADGPDCAGHEERWEKVLIAAAKQCGRTSLMAISPPQKMAALLTTTAHMPLRFMAHNDPTLPNLKSALTRFSAPPTHVLLAIGPEGGFSRQELLLAANAGVVLFQFGRYTLRAETAALVMASVLQFYFEPTLAR
jgi:16S rRNA (uracil1498-N3)-methyltransferase